MEDPNQYINNMTDGATAGYRYFDLQTAHSVTLRVRGTAKGTMILRNGKEGSEIAQISINATSNWTDFTAPISYTPGKAALYFTYTGEGSLDFLSFTFA